MTGCSKNRRTVDGLEVTGYSSEHPCSVQIDKHHLASMLLMCGRPKHLKETHA